MSLLFNMLSQFSSVAQLCPTLRDPMNCSTPGLPAHHQLPEFTQTHVHWVSDAIQPFHPLSSPSPHAPNPSQHQSFPMSQLFTWGGQSTGVSALASFLPKRSQGWSRLVITFLSRSKHLLISWLQSPSAVILEPKKIKSVTVSIVSPSICHEVMWCKVMPWRSASRLYTVTLCIWLLCRVHQEKRWTGWSTSWNQDCREKYQ